MEDKFDQNNFEEFLQEQVRNQRMYPSDAVWRDINKKLHGEKRWPGLTIAAFLLLSATVAICIHFTPKSNIFSLKSTIEPIQSRQIAKQGENVLNRLTSSAPFAKDKNIVTEPTIAQPSPDSHITAPLVPDENAVVNNRESSASETPVVEEKEMQKAVSHPAILPNTISPQTLVSNTPESISLEEVYKPIDINSTALSSLVVNEKKAKALNAQPTEKKDDNDKNMVDQFLKEQSADIALFTVTKPNTVKNKFGFQVYVVPSFSYRKLTEDRSIAKDNNGGPVGLNYVTDVNNVVRHKPGVGMETGLSIFYNLSNKIRVKSGLQFNVRQYTIDAFRANTEIASIALVGANRIDTVNTIALYRNNNGYLATELVNRYYQFAIPIGLEWEVIGNRRVQLNVAAGIQPTYLVNRNAYLLSTNFKNYTENPDMVRRWNLNSNLEAFISYQVGKYKWQVGPQIRYQPYSTFIKEYPIKEHLLDYGVKLGVSKIF